MSAAGPLVVGRIATLAGDQGFGWVEAIAIDAGRIVAAGSRDDVEAGTRPGTRRIELAPDEAALPGLTDAHLHLADAALAADRVDLSATRSPTEALGLLASAQERLPTPDAWLLGQRWDASAWGTWPLAAELDRVTGPRPSLLWSHDHHAVWVNGAALAAAGIDAATPDPPGGLIRRLPDGRPAGTLHEEAIRLCAAVVPPPAPAVLDDAIARYAAGLLRLGIVAVHDPGPMGRDPLLELGFASVGRLDLAGRLPIRVHASVRADSLGVALRRGLRTGRPIAGDDGPGTGRDGEPMARVGWLKLFADGAFGSRTAALIAPYEPDPSRDAPVGGMRGMFVTEPEVLASFAGLAADGGIATQIHAIGDAAVRAALDALAPVAPRAPDGPRPRLEHVQLLEPADLERFARLGIAASVQPGHLIGDAAMARAALGDHAERAYPLASLAERGIRLAFGSDAPVEDADPWPGIAIAVTRRASGWPEGTPPFGAKEALLLARAIRAACLDPALVAGEGDRGRLVPGHRADLVVVPGAALTEPVEIGGALERIRPRLVVVGGETVAGDA